MGMLGLSFIYKIKKKLLESPCTWSLKLNKNMQVKVKVWDGTLSLFSLKLQAKK